MADRPDARPAHRGGKPFEVAHRPLPAIMTVGRRRAVAVAALIVAVHVADRAQPLCERPVDAAEKSGRVQNHDWRAVAAPVQRVHLDAVDVHEARRRFTEFRAAAAGLDFFHVSVLRGSTLATDSGFTGWLCSRSPPTPDRQPWLRESGCLRV